MKNTFDVGRVRVLEYMRTYQEYFGKLPILIRYKEYVATCLDVSIQRMAIFKEPVPSFSTYIYMHILKVVTLNKI